MLTSISKAALLGASLFAVSAPLAHASGFAVVESQAEKNLQTCLDADPAMVSQSRAIRACTDALRRSVPDFELRAQILSQRGLLYMAEGKLEKADRDFETARRLDEANAAACNGQGFSDILKGEYQSAEARFNGCLGSGDGQALSYYGLAIAQELSGDVDGAYANYNKAADLKPGWDSPQDQLDRFTVVSLVASAN